MFAIRNIDFVFCLKEKNPTEAIEDATHGMKRH